MNEGSYAAAEPSRPCVQLWSQTFLQTSLTFQSSVISIKISASVLLARKSRVVRLRVSGRKKKKKIAEEPRQKEKHRERRFHRRSVPVPLVQTLHWLVFTVVQAAVPLKPVSLKNIKNSDVSAIVLIHQPSSTSPPHTLSHFHTHTHTRAAARETQ